MDSKSHWEHVYQTKAPDAVSWYVPHLKTSLNFIVRAARSREQAVIDVGGGEATLVEDLLQQGFTNLTVFDLSETTLKVARMRVGARSEGVKWVVGDVLNVELPKEAFDIWHDRAVFHFLTKADDRVRYVQQALTALKPGGYAIVGSFGPKGPEQCSGLSVCRYDTDSLHAEFGGNFQLLDSILEQHITPWDRRQQFVYCFCRRHG